MPKLSQFSSWPGAGILKELDEAMVRFEARSSPPLQKPEGQGLLIEKMS